MDGKSKWFVPKNNSFGGYHVAIEIIPRGEGCFVAVHSGLGKYDMGVIDELNSLMDESDIRYLTDHKDASLKFNNAVEFMKKQSAFRMVE